jgi:para-nitrobenzyl esterase
LFARAIAQSGTANRLGDRDTAAGTAHMLAQRLGLPDARVDRFRAVSWEALLEAQNALNGAVGLYAPIVDGESIPTRPLSAVRAGVAAEVPFLIGTNRDEAKFYVDPKRAPLADAALELRVRQLLPHKAREHTARMIATYRSSRQAHRLPHSNNDILDAIDTDSRFRIPSTRLGDAQAQHQPNTFMYLFDWESPAHRNTMGACHALELAFMFGTLDIPGGDRFTGSGPAAEQLSAAMMDAWLAFAKTGDPSCAALGAWPRYEASERRTMILGARCRPESSPFESERAAWEALL